MCNPSLQLSPHSFVAGREGRRRWWAKQRCGAGRLESAKPVASLRAVVDAGGEQSFLSSPGYKPVWKPALPVSLRLAAFAISLSLKNQIQGFNAQNFHSPASSECLKSK